MHKIEETYLQKPPQFCPVLDRQANSWLPQVRKWSGKKILQGQGNVREFYSGSGKTGILKKRQGKLKLKVFGHIHSMSNFGLFFFFRPNELNFCMWSPI